jgi:magnesium-transporting ATPase (P-type)
MTTLAFILGALRLSARGAVVQRLSAVESMAGVTVLCLDKTGTLTTNRLRLEAVRAVAPGVSEEEVRGQLALFGHTSLDGQNKTIQALRIAFLTSESGGEVLDRLPFKSQNRYSAVRLRLDGENKELILALGACEALRPLLRGGGDWERVWRELLPGGQRLLLFARAVVDPGVGGFSGSLTGVELDPLALVVLGDELRPGVGAVLADLAGQGVGLKVLSGDHPETVRAVLERATRGRADLLGGRGAVTGEELARSTDPARLAAECAIFARVVPRQKVEIIEALQRQGHRVAMLGDGINDILAIKRADLGVAMGEGSQATKTVAALVLQNNDFALLPAALAEGRNILRNLRRAGKVFLLKNVYTLLLIVLALGALGLPFPYLPQQVTLLNRLTISIPVLVITLSRTSVARARHANFLRDLAQFCLPTGGILALAGLALLLLSAWYFQDSVSAQRTELLAALVLLSLGNLPRVLTGEGEKLSPLDRVFLLWIPVAFLLLLGVLYWPLAADFFELAPLSLTQWGLVLAVSGPALLLCLALDWVSAGRSG